MTIFQELHKKAALHDQAAYLLRMDAARHEAEARRLRTDAEKEDATP